MIDEPKHFKEKIPLFKTKPAVLISDTEDADQERFQEIIIPLKLETPLSPEVDKLVVTAATPHQESYHNPVVNLPTLISEVPEPKLQRSPAEEEYQDVSISKFTTPEQQKWA